MVHDRQLLDAVARFDLVFHFRQEVFERAEPIARERVSEYANVVRNKRKIEFLQPARVVVTQRALPRILVWIESHRGAYLGPNRIRSEEARSCRVVVTGPHMIEPADFTADTT